MYFSLINISCLKHFSLLLQVTKSRTGAGIALVAGGLGGFVGGRGLDLEGGFVHVEGVGEVEVEVEVEVGEGEVVEVMVLLGERGGGHGDVIQGVCFLDVEVSCWLWQRE